jgi:hypothetical protein
MDVFAVDATTSNLLHWWYQGEWGGPENLGGQVTFSPSAVSWGPDRLDVFAIDANTFQLLHWWWDNPVHSGPPPARAIPRVRWEGPEVLGGSLIYGPCAVSWGPARLDVFRVDLSTHQLQHWWYENGWNGPQALPGISQSSLSAVSWGPGRLDIFAADFTTTNNNSDYWTIYPVL